MAVTVCAESGKRSTEYCPTKTTKVCMVLPEGEEELEETNGEAEEIGETEDSGEASGSGEDYEEQETSAEASDEYVIQTEGIYD